MRASTHPTAVLGGFYPTAGRGMMGRFGRAREGRGLGGQDFNAGFFWGLTRPDREMIRKSSGGAFSGTKGQGDRFQRGTGRAARGPGA